MNNKGFSLIELLIVIVIIGIIAVIAIPSLLESKKAAMAGAALQMLRNIASAEVAYSIRPPKVYGTLVQMAATGNMDNRFSVDGCVIDGYKFSWISTDPSQLLFAVSATPFPADTTMPSYAVGQSGSVYWLTDDAGGTAGQPVK
jgi:prepilin-type N-terminal cleavage/methylation domain-containing protein